MADETPIACSLSGSDMQARFGELREFGAETLTSRSFDQDGHRLRFQNRPEVEARLRAIIAGEEACCPFLNFELVAVDGELELRIVSPPDGRPVADQLAAAFG